MAGVRGRSSAEFVLFGRLLLQGPLLRLTEATHVHTLRVANILTTLPQTAPTLRSAV